VGDVAAVLTVSVVVPCFNLGAYLDEAVESVLGQTYQDFEIVIVDDGSDDAATRHLLASYRRPKARVIRAPHGGVARARNRGLHGSAGRYVSFLDADDVYESEYLAKAVEAMDSAPELAFVGCWLKAFGDADFSWTPERCDFPHLLAEDTVCTAALMRRDIVLAAGGFDDNPSIDGYEDWELPVRLVAQGHRGSIIPEFLFRYRIRAGSKSSTRTSPENHAVVIDYMLTKHAPSYRDHARGVLDVIDSRTRQLEEILRDPPRRPDASGADWRQAIFTAEMHRRTLEELTRELQPPVVERAVDWGSLRRLEPVSRVWGLDRGQPVDRYYIERFLERNADSITGDILEVKDPGYASAFGSRIRSLAVVDVAEHNPEATLVADLSQPDALPEDRYDCFLLTQTIHIIYEVDEVVRNAHRALAPGGVLLATLPCVSRVDYESGLGSDFWRFTPASARRLFEQSFGEGNVEVEAYGNVLACTAFLQGVAANELSLAELDQHDPYFPLLVAVRAVKAGRRRPDHPRRAVQGRHDGATCRSIFGWAWDPAAPEQRLRLDVWKGDHLLGTTTADRFRADLEQAGKGGGRVAFVFTPDADLHRSLAAEIRVTLVSSGEILAGSPRPVECVCESGMRAHASSPALLGSFLDRPRPGMPLPFPSLEISGWVLGRNGPLDAVEVLYRDRVIRRIPVDIDRPDLATAYPDVPAARRAGFATRVSLVAAGSPVQLELRALLPEGKSVPLAMIDGSVEATPVALPVIAFYDGGTHDLDSPALFAQTSQVVRALVRNPQDLPGHPGLELTAGSWNDALGAAGDVIWLSDGSEPVSEQFLSRATRTLADDPRAAFAAAAESPGAAGRGLVSVLTGTALGTTVVVRADVARMLGGFDDSAPSVAAVLWDLCIRAAAAGLGWAEFADVADPDAPTLAERADEESVRWLYRKHAPLYARQLRDVLLDREVLIADVLRRNHVAETLIESELRPLARAGRRERDRLGAKARRLRAGGRRTTTGGTDWGDFRRREPVSALWGRDRGSTVARYYTERFLQRHAHDIRGTVLEAHDAMYAHRYGSGRLRRCDVVDIDASNPHATIVADLRSASPIESATYDCVILSQALRFLDDNDAALRECHRILKPRGVLLATVPCVSRIDSESGVDGDYWRYTPSALQRLLDAVFAGGDVEVCAEGNRSAVLAFLVGLAAEEVGEETLDEPDDSAPVVLTARAVKRAEDRNR
jgi:GT2 family glycosyltransferase/SAM-dependent methyltransferase